MARKHISLEDLAAMVKRGFEESASKEELAALGKNMQDSFYAVSGDLDAIRSDIRDIKATLGPLVRVSAALEREVQELETRVGRLEREAGIK